MSTKEIQSRRKFVATSTAATASAGALGFPMIAKAEAINLRFQSTWHSKDIFHEYAQDFCNKVNSMSSGALKIDLLPADSVVPAFKLLDAVSKGVLDGGHGVLAYSYSKSPALALWGSGPAFGMDSNMLLAWHEYGGGKELLERIYEAMNLDVVSYLYGPMPTQPLGWFKKPITKVADMKGLRYRTVGLSIDIFKDMGVSVNDLPSGDIIPAMDRNLLDGAEFNNATSDSLLGLADVSKVCMLQSFHQCSEQFEILFNKKKLASMPEELRAMIAVAVQASSAEMSWKAIDRYSKDYMDLQSRQNVKFYKTPDLILRAQLMAWDKIIAAKSLESPDFSRVLESMRAFAQRACRWQNDTTVDFKMAYKHYFGRKTPIQKS